MIDTQVVRGSGNVFTYLGLPDPEERLVKAQLAIRIEELIKRSRLTQTQAAKRMGLSQPDVSNIVRGQLSGFAIDRLISCLATMGQVVEIRLPNYSATTDGALVYVTSAPLSGELA